MRTSKRQAFTRLDLMAIMAILGLVVLAIRPGLARSRESGQEAWCQNNVRQLGFALLRFGDENQDQVPEEGNTILPINHLQNADAWYNVAVQPEFPRLRDLYASNNIPLPNSGTVFSCPSAPEPPFVPTFAKAYFMYGMNGRLCINKATRNGQANTRFASLIAPRDTVLVAEVNGASPTTGAAQSSVTGQFAIARHHGYGLFAMTDGQVRVARTNEFQRTASENSSSDLEWSQPRSLYWYPSPNTPN